MEFCVTLSIPVVSSGRCYSVSGYMDLVFSGNLLMYCPKCGTQNDDNAFRCVNCREIIQQVPVRPRPVPVENDPAMRMIIPIDRSGLAIAAGYMGLVSVIYFFAPIALILGILAIRDIKMHPDKHGMGRAVFGVVMGAIFTVVLLLFVVFIITGAFSGR